MRPPASEVRDCVVGVEDQDAVADRPTELEAAAAAAQTERRRC
jgi:hypothetical protein